MSVNFNQKRELNINLDILDNIRTAIVIINRQYDYVYSNVAADDVLGSAKTIKKIDQLSCEDISIKSYIDNIYENEQSIMLRDLKFNNLNTDMGGNVGKALSKIALENMKNNDQELNWLVLELSSFQIEGSPKVAPTIGIWLSLIHI